MVPHRSLRIARSAALWRGLKGFSTADTRFIVKCKTSPRSRAVPVDISSVLTALRAFQGVHGHVIVPPRFIVPAVSHEEPSATWPEEIHGLKLGVALQQLSRVGWQRALEPLQEQFQAMGLDLHDQEDYKAFYWRATTLAALQAYQRLNGDLYVPRSFVVPTRRDWPLATWGLRLGQQVHALRKRANNANANNDEGHDQVLDSGSLPTYQREALEQIDFAWDVMEHKWITRFLPALERFHALHGHSNVPQKFIVPSQEQNSLDHQAWNDLIHCHGYHLGSAVNKVRRGDAFTSQVMRYFDDLLALGFTFSSFDRNWSHKVLPALESFHALHGHSNVGAYFDVPTGDARWPRATWGVGLGFIVQNIRSRGDFFPQIMRDSERLHAIAFVWNRSEAKWRWMVLPALETFVELYHHATIPASFVVPRETHWPRSAYGLRLGRIVALPSARRRFANYIEIDRKRLERLGLDWASNDVQEGEEEEEEEEEDEQEEEEYDGSINSESESESGRDDE